MKFIALGYEAVINLDKVIDAHVIRTQDYADTLLKVFPTGPRPEVGDVYVTLDCPSPNARLYKGEIAAEFRHFIQRVRSEH